MSEIVVQIEHANIYQSGSLILQDVNLNVQKGEFVYLVGKTGTGKSSLLKTLYGELTLTEGVGHVVGFNLKKSTNIDNSSSFNGSFNDKSISEPLSAKFSSIIFNIYKLKLPPNTNLELKFNIGNNMLSIFSGSSLETSKM